MCRPPNFHLGVIVGLLRSSRRTRGFSVSVIDPSPYLFLLPKVHCLPSPYFPLPLLNSQLVVHTPLPSILLPRPHSSPRPRSLPRPYSSPRPTPPSSKILPDPTSLPRPRSSPVQTPPHLQFSLRPPSSPRSLVLPSPSSSPRPWPLSKILPRSHSYTVHTLLPSTLLLDVFGPRTRPFLLHPDQEILEGVTLYDEGPQSLFHHITPRVYITPSVSFLCSPSFRS